MTFLSDLPPPVTFTHNETLHAILLPPLATFLSSLSAPEHFIKLQDLLDRYRTPQSYHRIDVRLVASSELPPGSPLTEQERGRAERERGEPVELPPGVALPREVADSAEQSQVEEGKDVDEAGTQGSAADIESQRGAVVDPVDPLSDSTKPFNEPNGMPAGGPVLPAENASANVIPIAPLPSSPLLSHPLPPSGPVRKVRELRLDLRSLDAAALFQLETWRREVLGLDRLEIIVPDSIWYKDVTPSPSPPPPAISASSSTSKRGRPRKNHLPEPIVITHNAVDMEQIELGAEIDGEGVLTKDQAETYESLVSALTAEGVIDPAVHGPPPATLIGDAEPAIQPGTLSQVLGDFAREVLDSDDSQLTQPGPGPGSGPGPEGGEAGSSDLQPQSSTTSPRFPLSPSPDIVLDDAFNETELSDPDFVPPPSPTSKPTRTRKPRKSLEVEMGMKIRKQKKARVSFDLSHLEEPDGADDPSPSPSLSDSTPRSGTRKRGRLRRSSYDGDDKLIQQVLDPALMIPIPVAPTSPTPMLTPMSTPVGSEKGSPISGTRLPTSQTRKRKSKVLGVELPAGRRRKSASRTKPIGAPNAGAAVQQAQAQVLRGPEDSDEEEEEEWGFLKAIK